jgi:hypothetical protein
MISEQKDLYIEYESNTSNNKKPSNPIWKWINDLNRHLSKKNTQINNEHMKRDSMSSTKREVGIKATMRTISYPRGLQNPKGTQ